jgi:hypothetical protein
MQKRFYRTIFENQLFECQAYTKSEARQIFKKMTAKRIGTTPTGGRIFTLKSRLRSKVRLTKVKD